MAFDMLPPGVTDRDLQPDQEECDPVDCETRDC